VAMGAAVGAAGVWTELAGDGGVSAANVPAMISLALAVPSAPQTGQRTGCGIRPLTG